LEQQFHKREKDKEKTKGEMLRQEANFAFSVSSRPVVVKADQCRRKKESSGGDRNVNS
jgi:hypothetical protein